MGAILYEDQCLPILHVLSYINLLAKINAFKTDNINYNKGGHISLEDIDDCIGLGCKCCTWWLCPWRECFTWKVVDATVVSNEPGQNTRLKKMKRWVWAITRDNVWRRYWWKRIYQGEIISEEDTDEKEYIKVIAQKMVALMWKIIEGL